MDKTYLLLLTILLQLPTLVDNFRGEFKLKMAGCKESGAWELLPGYTATLFPWHLVVKDVVRILKTSRKGGWADSGFLS